MISKNKPVRSKDAPSDDKSKSGRGSLKPLIKSKNKVEKEKEKNKSKSEKENSKPKFGFGNKKNKEEPKAQETNFEVASVLIGEDEIVDESFSPLIEEPVDTTPPNSIEMEIASPVPQEKVKSKFGFPKREKTLPKVTEGDSVEPTKKNNKITPEPKPRVKTKPVKAEREPKIKNKSDRENTGSFLDSLNFFKKKKNSEPEVSALNNDGRSVSDVLNKSNFDLIEPIFDICDSISMEDLKYRYVAPKVQQELQHRPLFGEELSVLVPQETLDQIIVNAEKADEDLDAMMRDLTTETFMPIVFDEAAATLHPNPAEDLVENPPENLTDFEKPFIDFTEDINQTVSDEVKFEEQIKPNSEEENKSEEFGFEKEVSHEEFKFEEEDPVQKTESESFPLIVEEESENKIEEIKFEEEKPDTQSTDNDGEILILDVESRELGVNMQNLGGLKDGLEKK